MHETLAFDDSTRMLLNAAIAAASDTGRPDRAWLEEAGLLTETLAEHAKAPNGDELYGRRVLAQTSRAEVVLAKWSSGATSAPHDHGEAKGFVLVLAGDHVYKMDYGKMLAQHVARGSRVTVACTEVPIADAVNFGVLEADAEGRVRAFQEKPSRPAGLARSIIIWIATSTS